MLHAVIRSEMNTVHFFSEVSRSNLEALREYVHDTAEAEGRVWLRMEVDEEEEQEFRQQTQSWLQAWPVAKGEFEGVIPAV